MILRILLALGPKNIHAASILLYHNIGRDGAYLTVTPENFVAQINFLHDRGYHVVSLRDLIDDLRHGHTIKSKTVALTFDDGFCGQYEFAFPLLSQHHIPATFFIATGLVGKSLRLSSGHDLPLMGWEQIWEIGSTPHLEVAPHSKSHGEFTALGYDKILDEVRGSRAAVEEKFGHRSNLFAYPRGKWTPEAIEILKAEGFDAVVTVHQGLVRAGDDPFILHRDTIDSSVTDLKLFEARLGWPIDFMAKLLHC